MLPSDLVKVLPTGLSAQDIWAHGVVRAGLEGSTGETHLALVGQAAGAGLLLMTRATTMTPARCEALALKPPPTFELGSFSAAWRLHTQGGRRYEVAVPGGSVGEVLALLARLYEVRGDGPEAVEALEQQLTVTRGTSARVALLARLAMLHEALGGWGEALACWVEVLQLESYQPPPERVQAALDLYVQHPKQTQGQGDALTRALVRAEQWAAAASALRAMASRDDGAPDAIHKGLLTLLDISRRLQDHPLTLWALSDLLRRALEGGAFNDARRHLDAIDDHSKLPDPAPAQALRALRDAAALAASLDAPAALRLDALRRIERLSVALHDLNGAIDSLEQQAALTPARDQDPLLQKRLDHLKALPDWPRWLDAALALSASTTDYSRARDLLLEAAHAAEHHLRDLPRALDLWRRVLDKVDPNHPAATDAIARLTVALRDWPAALAALEKRLSLTFDPAAARALLRDMALLAARHLPHPPTSTAPSDLTPPSDLPPAITYWQRLLHLDPKHPDALEALDAYFSAHQRWSDLMDILQRRVWAADPPASASPLLRRLASLWQSQLANPRQALDTWQRVLALHPHDTQVLLCVADLATQLDDLDTLEHTLRALAASPDLNPEQHIDVRFRLVHLLIDRLGDRDPEAIEVAWDILRRDPKRAAALDIIEARARARDDFANVARALEHRRALIPASQPDQHDPIDRALGHLYAAHLSRPADAIAAYARAWDRAPGDDTLFHALRDLYRATEQPDALIALKLRYADLLDQLDPPTPPAWFTTHTLRNQVTAHDAADHLRLQAADRCELRGDPSRALSLRLGMLHRHWADSTFLDSTLRCAIASGRAWDTVHTLTITRAALRLPDPDPQSPTLQRFDILCDECLSSLFARLRERNTPPAPDLLFAVARHYADDRAQPKAATRYLHMILDQSPHHAAAFDALCDAYKALGDWPSLSDALQRRLRALPPPKQDPAAAHQRAALLRALIHLHTHTFPEPAFVADLTKQLRRLQGGGSARLLVVLALLILLIAAAAVFLYGGTL